MRFDSILVYPAHVLIDLHCHTQPLSSCSSLSIESLVAGARVAGLDAVCLTEHDRSWPEAQVRKWSATYGMLILRGMEITTEAGHALVFGLDAPSPGMFLAASLRVEVERAGGLMILAHPARAGQPMLDTRERTRLFDAVEAVNGSDGPEQNRSAAVLSRGMTLPGIGGSDCHAPAEVGRAATRLQRWVQTEAELIEELRIGRHEAVWLAGAIAK